MVNYIKGKVISNKIRKAAESLKSNKEDKASQLVDGAVAACKSLPGPLTQSILMYQYFVDILSVFLRFIRIVTADSEVLAMFKTLVSNIIGDISSRMNEFANVSDKVTSNPDMIECIRRAQDTFEKMDAEIKAEVTRNRVAVIKEYLEKGDDFWTVLLDGPRVLDALLEDDSIPQELRDLMPKIYEKNLARAHKLGLAQDEARESQKEAERLAKEAAAAEQAKKQEAMIAQIKKDLE